MLFIISHFFTIERGFRRSLDVIFRVFVSITVNIGISKSVIIIVEN